MRAWLTDASSAFLWLRMGCLVTGHFVCSLLVWSFCGHGSEKMTGNRKSWLTLTLTSTPGCVSIIVPKNTNTVIASRYHGPSALRTVTLLVRAAVAVATALEFLSRSSTATVSGLCLADGVTTRVWPRYPLKCTVLAQYSPPVRPAGIQCPARGSESSAASPL